MKIWQTRLQEFWAADSRPGACGWLSDGTIHAPYCSQDNGDIIIFHISGSSYLSVARMRCAASFAYIISNMRPQFLGLWLFSNVTIPALSLADVVWGSGHWLLARKDSVSSVQPAEGDEMAAGTKQPETHWNIFNWSDIEIVEALCFNRTMLEQNMMLLVHPLRIIDFKGILLLRY